MKRLLAVVLGTLIGATAQAATFRLEFEGAPVAGGEVCISDARSLDDPLERLTTFTRVRCVSADSDVALPAGDGNLFARHADEYVSRRALVIRAGRVEGDQRVIELERAARLRLDFSLTKPETAGVYVERSGVVLPVVPGESEVVVPSGAPLFPLLMVGGAIRAIGAELQVDAGAVRALPRPATAKGKIDFAIGLVPDRGAFERIPSGERAPGKLELVAGDVPSVAAANRAAPAFRGEEALALFRQAAPTMGSGTVRVAGSGWASTGGELKEFRAEASLRIAPTTTLTVRWSVLDDVVSIADQIARAPRCPRVDATAPQKRDVPGAAESGLSVTLARCPGLQAGTPARAVGKSACAQLESAQLDEKKMAGAQTLNDVAPGVYLLRLGYGTLPAAFETIEVAQVDSRAAIELRFDRWFGKVTRDREPFFGWVEIGEGATTDPATGEYFTVSTPVPPPPPEVAHRMFSDAPPIGVQGCDSEIELLFVPDERPVPNTRFDIEIVPNTIVVNVIDAKSTKAIQDAKIIYVVYRRDIPDAVHFGGEFGKTDEGGAFTLSDVPRGREIELCALRDDYRKRCAERFVMSAEREKSVTIALDAVDIRKGRVLHPAVGGGAVIWYRPDGRVLESAEIAADGTFTFKDPHAQGEVVAVVSAGAPLLVLRQPPLRDGEPFEIAFPAAQVRSFSVSLSPQAKEVKGFVSLSVGDIVVPLNVLSRHLRPRGARPLFLSPGEIAVRDIVASGPVSFIFAPMSWAETYGGDLSIDFFYLPAAAALPRVPAGAGANVVVGE
ncbi:MAG: hypothetical protein WC538_12405 [Thermoanaerobaculia bacterium]|jgi:hypothetical protein